MFNVATQTKQLTNKSPKLQTATRSNIIAKHFFYFVHRFHSRTLVINFLFGGIFMVFGNCEASTEWQWFSELCCPNLRNFKILSHLFKFEMSPNKDAFDPPNRDNQVQIAKHSGMWCNPNWTLKPFRCSEDSKQSKIVLMPGNRRQKTVAVDNMVSFKTASLPLFEETVHCPHLCQLFLIILFLIVFVCGVQHLESGFLGIWHLWISTASHQ